MSKFKVGDAVRVVVDDSVDGMAGTPDRGTVGRIVETEYIDDGEYGVEFEDWANDFGPYIYEENELEAVE